MPNVTLPFGINFRATVGLVTDAPGFVPQSSEFATSNDGSSLYTTARMYGWNAPGGAQSARTRDLSTTANARFCGDAFIFNGFAGDQLRIDTQAGTYDFRIAAALNCYFAVYDGDSTTAQILVDRATTPVNSGYIDATGVVRASEAAWLSDNAAASVTCLSGWLRVVIGKSGTGDSYGTYHSLDIALTGAITEPTFTGPSDIEVSQPATATFSVALGGGSYTGLRWQTRPNSGGSITDISGANTTSYTTGATSLGMSGSQYRLAADWAGGTAYSAWATLTVNEGPAGDVSNVIGEPVSGTTATVSFTPGTPAATSHTLQLESPSGAGNWTNATATLSGSVFSVTDLTGVTQYRPRVRATNGAGSSAWVIGNAFTTDNVGGGTVTVPAATSVVADFALSWSVLANVSVTRDFALSWSVSNSVSVTRDYSMSWSIAAPVVGGNEPWPISVTLTPYYAVNPKITVLRPRVR